MSMTGNGLDSEWAGEGEIYVHSSEREPRGAQLANRKGHGGWRVRNHYLGRAWSFMGE